MSRERNEADVTDVLLTLEQKQNREVRRRENFAGSHVCC